MKVKKIVMVMTSLILSSVLFAGCGGNTAQPNKAQPSETDKKVESTKEPKKAPVELSVGYSAGDEAATKSLEVLIKEYNENQENYIIKPDPISGNVNDVLKTRMASNTEPDLMPMDPQLISSLVESNRLLELDPYLSGYDIDDFENATLDAGKYKGKIYALPLDYNTLILFYNKKMLQEAGVSVPTTWDELKDAAKKLTKGNIKGLSLQNELPRFQPFLYSNGGTMMKDGKPYVNSKENAEALGYWISLFKDGVAATPADLGVGWNGDSFAQELVAMTVEGHWMMPYIEKLKPDMEWGAVPIPIKKQPASMVFMGVYSISANTKDKEGAVDFLKFLASKRGIQSKVDGGGGGVIPARKSMKEEFLKLSPEKQAALDAVESSSLFIYGLKSPEVIKQMNDAAEALRLGAETDPQAALDKVQQALDK
ncbi:MAG TPA: ABC transporter substrate-binding protein [Bacilli bacterium]